MKKFALIPTYEPDSKFVDFIKNISNYFEVIVVDDGSGIKYKEIFERAKIYSKIVQYNINRGKGYALKTGLKFIKENNNNEKYIIVTMDSDGQHSIEDAINLSNYAENNLDALVLGRRMRGKNTPLRSKIGNSISMILFSLLTGGKKIYDTQTGLRAFSNELIDIMLDIDGNRYDYEMNVLFRMIDEKIPIKEIDIKVIYIDNNSHSHFRTLRDSYLIFKKPLIYIFSSVSSFLMDYLLFNIILAISYNISISNILARVVSSIYNYLMNKNVVFKNKSNVAKTATEYFTLAVFILLINTIFVEFFINILKFNPQFAKILTEIILFIISYVVQKRVIFKNRKFYKKKSFKTCSFKFNNNMNKKIEEKIIEEKGKMNEEQ